MKRTSLLALPFFLLFLSLQSSPAGSATWALNPNGGSWDVNNPSNWVPNTVPNGPDDIATFDVSNITAISANDIDVNSIVFNPGASAYTITGFSFEGLAVTGAGVLNDSGTTQNFDTSTPFGNIFFTNSASAGSDTIYTAKAGRFSSEEGGDINFVGTSNGGSATLIAKGSQFEGSNGEINFAESSSAANATVIAEGGAILGGAPITFDDSASAGDATLIANYVQSGSGGGIIFSRFASGGNPRVILYGNGTIEPGNGGLGLISRKLSAGDFTIGSLEGDGGVGIGSIGPGLGTLNLNIGSNNLSTTYRGLIQQAGSAASITKIGTGTLTLTNGANTYSGGTNVNRGTLLVSNTTGLGAGGPIKVNAGTLGGSGTVQGPVTVGTGTGAGAFLAPARGTGKQATFTIQSALTLKADSTYSCSLKAKGNRARNDQVVAGSVTIDSGATFSLRATIQGTLTPGTVLMVISNTSVNPIAGEFANLPDGGLISGGGTTFQADYQGGSGNDLTLTVQ
jgi:autotransporter-associated beta strand protein